METDEGWQVRFNDARRFGLMLLVADEAIAKHKLFKGLGPEPLDETFDGAVLAGRLKGRRTDCEPAPRVAEAGQQGERRRRRADVRTDGLPLRGCRLPRRRQGKPGQ